MCFAPAAEVDDMSSRDPDRVPDAARALRKPLELGVHYAPLLCAQDGRAHGIAVEGVCDALLWALEAKVEGGAVGQVVGGATGPVVDVVRLDLRARQLSDQLAEADLALVGGFEGGLDDSAGVLVHGGSFPGVNDLIGQLVGMSFG